MPMTKTIANIHSHHENSPYTNGSSVAFAKKVSAGQNMHNINAARPITEAEVLSF